MRILSHYPFVLNSLQRRSTRKTESSLDGVQATKKSPTASNLLDYKIEEAIDLMVPVLEKNLLGRIG